MGTLIAGGLLTCMAVVIAAGPAAADADAPGAPQAHAWDRDGDGHGCGGREHEGWGREGWHHGHGHGDVAAMFRELGLTDQQRADMKSLVEAAGPSLQSLHEQLLANSMRLRQTSPDDKAYASVIAKLSEESGALTARLIKERSVLYAKCYALLAPIQKTRLAELLAKHAKWLEEHKEHMQEQLREHMDGHGPHAGAGIGGGASPN
ncbi:MAG: Spy/CpxP family protein refolding chaperone [Steroidobacterales bacterium]